MRELTPRQMEVLRLHAHLPRSEVAYRLGITETTLKHHLTSAYRKLGVQSLTQAWVALGWLKVPDA